MPLRTMFATPLYEEPLIDGGARDETLVDDLARACRALMAADRAGRDWSIVHDYRGYTSFESVRDLPARAPFAALVALLDGHAARFAETCRFNAGRPPRLDRIWVNVMKPGGYHTGHLHPGTAIAGTVYVEVPRGSGPIVFEDPRMAMMMAVPGRDDLHQRIEPKVGHVMLWESWLRHEVRPNRAKGPRISLSFNYRL